MSLFNSKPVSKAYIQFCKQYSISCNDPERIQDAFFNGARTMFYTMTISDTVLETAVKELIVVVEELRKNINYKLPERARVEGTMTINEIYLKSCELTGYPDTPGVYRAFVNGALFMFRLSLKRSKLNAALKELDIA